MDPSSRSRPLSRARHVVAVLVAALAAASLLAGCGKKDERDVRTTVEAFYSAVTAGEGLKACERLTTRARAQLERGGQPCPRAILREANLGSRAGVGNIVVNDKRATASANAATQKRTLQMRKVGKVWRVDGGF